MAEKNTLSILETIKKKMSKFDQKVEKTSKLADLNDEFQYISPGAKRQSEENRINIKSQEIPNFEESHDLGAKTGPRLEDPDFDLDDESKPKEVKDEYIFEEEDVEDYEDEADLEEGEDESEEEAESSESVDDDFDLNVFESDEEEVEETREASDNDDELSLDNIDLDDHEENSEEHHVEETVVETITESVLEAAVEEPIADKKDDLDLAAIAAEYEAENPTQPVETAQIAVEQAQAAQPIEQPVIETLVSEAVFEQAAKKAADVEDVLNFDDLENEVEQEVKPKEFEVAPIVAQSPLNQAEPQNIPSEGRNLEDELDQLDKELEKQKLEAEKKKTEEKISPLEEIDLEFEKEIMGLKPQFTEEKPVEKPQEVAKKEELEKEAPTQTLEEIENILFNNDGLATSQAQATTASQPLIQDVSPKDLPQEVKQNPLQWQDIEKMNPQQDTKSVPNQVSQTAKLPAFDSMIREETVHRASDSIKRLMDAKNVVEGISTFSKSPAFSELAVRIMEPKLEKWLNENLPHLVENIVRDEIKKIIPKE